jgi:hypothetical protein
LAVGGLKREGGAEKTAGGGRGTYYVSFSNKGDLYGRRGII